jgi:phage/plasmid-associated DNA primase
MDKVQIRNSTESFIVDLMQLVYPKYLDNLNQIERSDPSLSVNSAKIFIRDHLIKGQSELDDTIGASRLYDIYEKWAEGNKYKVESQTAFGRAMRDSKYEKKRTSAGKVYVRVNVKAVGKVIASLQK